MIPFPLNYPYTFFYGYARAALSAGLDLLPDKSCEVLVPAFICDSVLKVLRYKHIKYDVYNLTEYLEPDISDINKNIRKNTKAIIVVNYFGFSKITNEIRDYCKNKELILIEDNAHGFLSKINDKYLGSSGDISIFSFRKSVRIPNGAALVVNDKELINNKNKIYKFNKNERGLRYTIKKISCLTEFYTGFEFNVLKKIKRNVMDVSEKDNIENYLVDISKSSTSLLSKINNKFPQIAVNRITKYHSLIKYCQDKYKLSALFPDLDTGICPYGIPFLSDERESIVKELNSIGIKSGVWPNRPDKIDGFSTLVQKLYNKLFLIYLGY